MDGVGVVGGVNTILAEQQRARDFARPLRYRDLDAEIGQRFHDHGMKIADR